MRGFGEGDIETNLITATAAQDVTRRAGGIEQADIIDDRAIGVIDHAAGRPHFGDQARDIIVARRPVIRYRHSVARRRCPAA